MQKKNWCDNRFLLLFRIAIVSRLKNMWGKYNANIMQMRSRAVKHVNRQKDTDKLTPEYLLVNRQ